MKCDYSGAPFLGFNPQFCSLPCPGAESQPGSGWRQLRRGEQPNTSAMSSAKIGFGSALRAAPTPPASRRGETRTYAHFARSLVRNVARRHLVEFDARICPDRSVSRPSFSQRKTSPFCPPLPRGPSSEEKMTDLSQKRNTCSDAVLGPIFETSRQANGQQKTTD